MQLYVDLLEWFERDAWTGSPVVPGIWNLLQQNPSKKPVYNPIDQRNKKSGYGWWARWKKLALTLDLNDEKNGLIELGKEFQSLGL